MPDNHPMDTPGKPDKAQVSADSLETYLSSGRAWPFTHSELSAGLRRYTGDHTLKVLHFSDREITQRLPAVGRLRGIEVQAEGSEGERTFYLVLKEPHGSTRTGAAGAGLREVSVYQTLKEHLPVKLPDLIAAHPRGEWLVLEHLLPGRRPANWSAADYLLAAEQLALLHDRFWGLGTDLAVYSWLEQPLKADRDIYLQAAVKDAHDLADHASNDLANSTDIPEITRRIIEQFYAIIETLENSPTTLLHGDFWPGNILIHPKGGVTIYDWADAAIGPAVLDLLGFLQGSSWHFSPLPVPAAEIIDHYRSRLSQAGAHTYSNKEFSLLWDYAVMWTFVGGWASTLAKTPNSLLPMRLDALEEVLFTPLREAAERRL